MQNFKNLFSDFEFSCMSHVVCACRSCMLHCLVRVCLFAGSTAATAASDGSMAAMAASYGSTAATEASDSSTAASDGSK
jgi:hypothetical protein